MQDVAAAGGWSDTSTLAQVYPQPDQETMRQVMEYERPRERSRKAARHGAPDQESPTR